MVNATSSLGFKSSIRPPRGYHALSVNLLQGGNVPKTDPLRPFADSSNAVVLKSLSAHTVFDSRDSKKGRGHLELFRYRTYITRPPPSAYQSRSQGIAPGCPSSNALSFAGLHCILPSTERHRIFSTAPGSYPIRTSTVRSNVNPGSLHGIHVHCEASASSV